jgi:hypothetical protein
MITFADIPDAAQNVTDEPTATEALLYVVVVGVAIAVVVCIAADALSRMRDWRQRRG